VKATIRVTFEPCLSRPAPHLGRRGGEAAEGNGKFADVSGDGLLTAAAALVEGRQRDHAPTFASVRAEPSQPSEKPRSIESIARGSTGNGAASA
jgi:hypothetical protein